MTLEQIKNRQERINEDLRNHLQQSVQLTDYILGEEIQDPDGKEIAPAEGLLNKISEQQDITEILLGKLYSQHTRLFNSTYAPVEANKIQQ